MSSFVSDPFFLTNHFFIPGFGKVLLDEDLVNPIVRDVFFMVSIDDFLEQTGTYSVFLVRLVYEAYILFEDGLGGTPNLLSQVWYHAGLVIECPDLVHPSDADSGYFSSLVRRPSLIFASKRLDELPLREFHTLKKLTEGK